MLRSRIPAAVITALIVVDEELFACTAATFLPHVRLLGLFGVVVEGALEFVEQRVVEVEAQLDQNIVDGFEGNKGDVITHMQQMRLDRLHMMDALDTAQHKAGIVGMGDARIQTAKTNFAVADQCGVISIHAFDTIPEGRLIKLEPTAGYAEMAPIPTRSFPSKSLRISVSWYPASCSSVITDTPWS